MEKQLPSRPHLDHLRRQAKSLLASLAAGDPAAVATFREYLPAAKSMNPEAVRSARFRLADAQSAVARQSGFESWPQLSRHVEQLRSLEGSWSFVQLEIDGAPIPPAGLQSSRILIDGDRFRTESPEAIYEGIFNINVEAQPHQIEIEFVEGPEAGNWNFGIFRLQGDQLEICLDLNGKPCPAAFRTTPGSGHAYETLKRSSGSRPDGVSGGRSAPIAPPATPAHNGEGFDGPPTPTITRLQGEWSAEKLVRDGSELPSMMLAVGRRSMTGNELKIIFGGQLMIHALVRFNEQTQPLQVDYFNLSGAAKGTVQHGIMEWRDTLACFCMAAPGQPRPSDFTCAKGSGRTLSLWRPTI